MARRSEQLTSAMDYAFAELDRVGGVPDLLPAPVRTVVVIISAQGVIDNGGLQYFFEADFPNSPPYTVFTDAYREIGADTAADDIAAAVALFPFAEPHLSKDKRNEFLDSFKDEDADPVANPFEPLSKRLCGSQSIWRALDAFVGRHATSFPRPGGGR
jgi:hypothetical protein